MFEKPKIIEDKIINKNNIILNTIKKLNFIDENKELSKLIKKNNNNIFIKTYTKSEQLKIKYKKIKNEEENIKNLKNKININLDKMNFILKKSQRSIKKIKNNF